MLRKAKAWTPAPADRERLTEHLFYEVQMTFFLAEQLSSPAAARLDLSLRNAQVESFALHLHQLIAFFWGERPRSAGARDACAADFYPPGAWERLRPAPAPVLERAVAERRGWRIAKLTYDRELVRPADRIWDALPQAFALAPVVKRFVETVDHSQFLPGYLNGMKICAETFASGEHARDAHAA